VEKIIFFYLKYSFYTPVCYPLGSGAWVCPLPTFSEATLLFDIFEDILTLFTCWYEDGRECYSHGGRCL